MVKHSSYPSHLLSFISRALRLSTAARHYTHQAKRQTRAPRHRKGKEEISERKRKAKLSPLARLSSILCSLKSLNPQHPTLSLFLFLSLPHSLARYIFRGSSLKELLQLIHFNRKHNLICCNSRCLGNRDSDSDSVRRATGAGPDFRNYPYQNLSGPSAQSSQHQYSPDRLFDFSPIKAR